MLLHAILNRIISQDPVFKFGSLINPSLLNKWTYSLVYLSYGHVKILNICAASPINFLKDFYI
jgi:hypothetical protein